MFRRASALFLCIAAGFVGGMNLYNVIHPDGGAANAALSALLAALMFGFAVINGKEAL